MNSQPKLHVPVHAYKDEEFGKRRFDGGAISRGGLGGGYFGGGFGGGKGKFDGGVIGSGVYYGGRLEGGKRELAVVDLKVAKEDSADQQSVVGEREDLVMVDSDVVMKVLEKVREDSEVEK